jgi:hypothetical protein
MKTSLKLLLLLSAALSGCTIIDRREPVPGWPALKVVEHHVAHDEMRDRCSPTVSAFFAAEACTYFDFDKSEAHIYVSKDFPTDWVLRHERLHAAGYDHFGSSSMREMLESWKKSKR